jgi:peptidase M49-like protein
MRFTKGLVLVGAFTVITACGGEKKVEPAKEAPVAIPEPVKPAVEEPSAKEKEVGNDIKAMLAKFAPTEIGVDEDRINPKLRPVIKKLVEAARLMDQLFLTQVHKDNPKWRDELAKDPANKDILAYFDIMYGPWDRLEHNNVFFGEVKKPKGATFYPEDLTKEELEKWIAEHPEQKEAFTGYFTLVERDGEGLKTVPYNEAYKEFLEPAAKLLDEAAALAEDKRLKTYLTSRARAFRDNEYRQSDMDWMDLGDGDIEIVIGPYEVYEDELVGYKAAFEAFVTLRDPADSKELARIKTLLPEMEAYLPIPDEYKNLDRGSESPIAVVDVLYTGGDTRSGVQTLAFNLPNDEVVREKKGSKKVMLKNVAHAKYNQILMPIARKLMREDQVKNVSFEAFFNHTLVHETAHGLGPGKIKITKDGKEVETTVNAELKDLYPAIEEAKADVLGMYLNYMLVEKGLRPKSFMEQTYASFMGGFFRSVRFGAGEAHGMANVMQYNYLVEKGAIIVEEGKYVYVAEKMREAVKGFAHDILMIEAKGSYDAAKAFIDKYGALPDELKESLDSLSEIPTDLRPTYPIEKQMQAW